MGHRPAITCLQAGNVNTRGCEPYPEAIQAAKEHQALVHVDSAFALWAGASRQRESEHDKPFKPSVHRFQIGPLTPLFR